jgi:GIY-YIG catalytic domain
MLTFNSILEHEHIDPRNVRLVRHQDNRAASASRTPYNLWRAREGGLELYQRIQKRKVFEIGGFLASFVVTPAEETLFIGLYRVDSIGVAPPGTIDPVLQADRAGLHLYEISQEEKLSEYAGHVIVAWGGGHRAWLQLAHRQDKQFLEIRKELREEPFPGFTNFCWDIDAITAIPLTWQSVLKSVKGVYLLVCKETGKQYIGSAKGEQNLWARFLDYKTTGHGGNIELRACGRKQYQVTVLEVVNSDEGIERVEGAWKRKLMSREFGLNRN